MTPTVIQRLRATLTSERIACGHPAHSETTLPYERLTNAELTAVEQELAAKDAEIAEIRELVERVSARRNIVGALDIADLAAALLICALYAEKARAEAPK